MAPRSSSCNWRTSGKCRSTLVITIDDSSIRNGNHEFGAAFVAIAGNDTRAVAFHDRMDDVQAEAGVLALGGKMGFEDAGEDFRLDAGPVVAEADDATRIAPLGREFEDAP